MGLTSGLASARVSLGRIFELFDAKPDVTERPDALPLSHAGEIRFDHVAMGYDRGAVLHDIDLTIAPGSLCAILGSSGVGKSTMADLMVRYLDPQAGRVLIDGRDMRDYRLDDLRREIILVDQSPYLFNDSIAANIGFALPDVTRAQIETAAHAAGLDDFIARLPAGFDTPAGERGMALSAGERQRIVLARALLRQPGILILDEPTSALDEETEQLVAGRLRAALPAATIIVITHKPALTLMADCIVRVENGHAIVQQNREEVDA